MKRVLMFVLTMAMMTSISFAQDISIILNGEKLKSDVAPTEIQGRVMVPVRVISEKLGATVNFNFDTNEIAITRNNNVINLTLESKNAYINGQLKVLDVPAKEINNRTLVPIRFVGESLGADVTWDDTTWSVYITSKNRPVVNQPVNNQPLENKPVGNKPTESTTRVAGLYEAGTNTLKYTWDELIANQTIRVGELFTYDDDYNKVSEGFGVDYCNRDISGDLVVEEGIKVIDQMAFDMCKNLQSVILPNSVTKIGYGAFAYCKELKKVELSNNLVEIGSEAFRNCTSLTSIDIPSGVTKLKSGTFFLCTGLESVRIPNTVTDIEEIVFGVCSKLTTIDIPNGVKTMGEEIFSNCSNLTSVKIPNSIQSIGKNAFLSCSNLKKIIVNKGASERIKEMIPEYESLVVE